MLTSELLVDSRLSSCRNGAIFLLVPDLAVPGFDHEVWLLAVVALFNDGLRSSLRNMRSGDSLLPVCPVPGRPGPAWSVRPSDQNPPDPKPFDVGPGGPSLIQGAMSKLDPVFGVVRDAAGGMTFFAVANLEGSCRPVTLRCALGEISSGE